ncbi:MAG: NF038122 family metalloprotease [Rivularia sp. (in: cyanobacteria)]
MKLNKPIKGQKKLFSQGKLILQTLLSISVGLIATNLPAQALKFNFSYAPGTTYDQMLGFEMAGKYWSNHLTDDVTLNIFVESTSMLPENVIGGALPGMVQSTKHEEFRSYFQNDITSTTDANAFNSFNTDKDGKKYNIMVDGEEAKDMKELNLTRASAKSLGMISGDDEGLDGYILISDLSNITKQLSWNQNYQSDTVSNGTLDLFSMAVHELGHTLGFVSSGDDPGWIDAVKKEKRAGKRVKGDKAKGHITLLDLYRYSSESTSSEKTADKKQGMPDLSIGGNPFFSVNRGRTTIAKFATGEDGELGGDGYQSSHWKQQSNVLGIMDPTLGVGQRRQVTSLDLTAIDVLGWDVQQGNVDFTTLYNHAQTQLLQKFGVSPTPLQWIDEDGDRKDDRGELLNEMIRNSGDIYQWGWKGYKWGWNGFWWGWNGFWQSHEELKEDGFWQNVAWQKMDFNQSNSVEVKSTPEPTSLIGLLGLSLFGIISRSQGFLGRKRDAE